MAERLVEAGVVLALAAAMTVAMAALVLQAPSERIFGAEIVGRHHDPFTVMQHFARPLSLSTYTQPITDVAGALAARVSGVVAGYNALVLISFPLTAAAAYLLARHLLLSPMAAAVAALACAFSPFHVAHAAYHPHVAQVQWLPLYLLALWRCLDAATPVAVAALAAATVAVTLSNFYGGLIAATITPVAIAAYWFTTRARRTSPLRPLVVTIASLLLLASMGLAYARWMTSAAAANDATLNASRIDLFRYSADWSSYLVPPVAHPLLGGPARRFWAAAGVHNGLLEQQVSLGWGVMLLAAFGVWWWITRRPDSAVFARVPVLVCVAVTALLCSFAPERTIGQWTMPQPSALLYTLAPMFRSYARFGVVVQLMAALLAGIGVDFLLRSGTRRAQYLCMALVTLVAVEYAVAPSAMWRDVLPTSAHRWVMQQAASRRVLDCVPATPESATVQWLTHDRVTTLSSSIDDCAEPGLAAKLAAHDYTHVLARTALAPGRSPTVGAALAGLTVAASFDDGRVYAVTAPRPAIYTSTMTGFSPREHDRDWSWRWMGADAAWIIDNTTPRPTVAILDVELSAFHHDRRVTMLLNRKIVQTLVVASPRRTYRIGPFTVPPGAHELAFLPAEPPTVADDLIHNRDRRPLSVAIGTWAWRVAEEHP